jgi:hypothetical protein
MPSDLPNGPPWSQWHVAALFASPLIFLCRCKIPGLSPLWLPAIVIVWLAVFYCGFFGYLFLQEFGIMLTGVVGALLVADCFAILVRRIGSQELLLLATLGLLGGVVFALTLQEAPNVGEFAGGPLGSKRGFAVWQVLVGSFLVYLSRLENPLKLPRSSSLTE